MQDLPALCYWPLKLVPEMHKNPLLMKPSRKLFLNQFQTRYTTKS